MAHPGSFVLWGPDHLTVLLLTLGGVVALLISRQRLGRLHDVSLRRGIAMVLFGNEFVAWVWAAVHGVARIPLQLCDLALLLTVAALWSPRPRACELAYFWGLVGSSQAILTPDLQHPFPDYWWLKFFATHCGVVLSVVYLAVTGRVRLMDRSVWRVWGLTNLYAGMVGLINWIAGTNYGYLARKPMQPSLLDVFGPWPLYIVVMDVAALALFSLAALPVRVRPDGMRAVS